jgi:hypothetical protein
MAREICPGPGHHDRKASLATIAHKQSPLLELTKDLVSNEDYFGDLIRNPEDPVGKQLEQVGQYVLRDIQPFSIQQFRRAGQETATAEGKAEAFSGFVKAPASMERTPAETVMHGYIGALPGRTPEQVEQAGENKDLRDAFARGDTDAVRQLVASGQYGARTVTSAAKRSALTGFQSAFQSGRLTLDQQLNVYEKATEQQRVQLKPLFGNLDVRLMNLPPAEVPRVVQRMRDLGILKKPPLRLSPPPVDVASAARPEVRQ